MYILKPLSRIFGILMLILGNGLAIAKNDKPNILVIWGDDIGWFNVSPYNRHLLRHM
jgi:arylsulfatase